MSTELDRRDFLRSAGALAAAPAILPTVAAAAAAPANERAVLAVVGIRGRGHTLATALAQRPDCRVAYLCDVDRTLFPARAESLAKLQGGRAPKFLPDFRRALDDRAVDAVVVATPDHWHCLAAIWACRAGKDVYVESPLSHDCWEGRRVAESAQKHNRVIQVGMASRSAAYALSAKKYIEEGKLGKIHLCRVFGQKGQSNFPAKPDSRPPEGFDWDLWNGPAPQSPYNVNYHNNWHGWWRYSGGDMAVDGIHQLDLARWLCGVDYPKSVYASGGRFDSQGANETPDTLSVIYEFEKLVMNFDLSLYTPYMLKVSPVVRSGEAYPLWPHCGQRIEIYGSDGVMRVAPNGGSWQVFARPRREQAAVVDQSLGQASEAEHLANFVECIRSRKRPNADAEEGQRSALMVHYANLSYRVGGQKLVIDPKTERIVGNNEAMDLFRRTYRKPYVIEGESGAAP